MTEFFLFLVFIRFGQWR